MIMRCALLSRWLRYVYDELYPPRWKSSTDFALMNILIEWPDIKSTLNSSPGRRSRRRDGKGKIVNLERKYFSLAAWQRDSLTMQLSLSLYYSVNDQTGWKIILKLQLPLFWMRMFFTLLCIFHLSLFQNVTTDNRRGSQNEIACGTNFHFFFEREKTFEKLSTLFLL